MSWLTRAVMVAPVAAAALTIFPSDAEACGGCFVPPEENTQVTGHRMILSVGMDQSTLYDQIEYSGNPEEFAWVLPTKGVVEVGVSSDVVFNQLGFDTAVSVAPPPLNCPSYTCGNRGDASAEDSFGASGSGGGSQGGVEVIASGTVGPYETVQLSADDPAALNLWLDENGYNVPDDIQPIIDSYVAEDFNFLAMKLVPGAGVERMQPVRITTPGASPVLPLRMVAAGTGAVTTLTLWVIGDGRYESQNFPGFTIPAEAVVWNYQSNDSNYNLLRQEGYDASNGHAWLTEASREYFADNFSSTILQIVNQLGPEQSGYDDGSGDWEAAYARAEEDMQVLFDGIQGTAYVTRLRAELSRAALGQDLLVQAADDQSTISNFIQTTKWEGTQPACPPKPDCGDFGGGDDDVFNSGGGSCALTSERSSEGNALGLSLLAIVGLALARRRRKSSRN